MSTNLQRVLPTMAELVSETESSIKQNQLTVLLNQAPPAAWLKNHPMAKTKNEQGQNVEAKYLPIDKVEYLLHKIYGGYRVEVRSVEVLANSVCVTVRLFVVNPLTGVEEWNDGVGAKSIQTDAGAGAMDWNKAKDAGVMMALPSAKTYAIKDAAEHFGRIFGRDLNRTNQVDYMTILKQVVTREELLELYELKKDSIDADLKENAERIITNNETDKFKSLFKTLQSC